VGAEQVPCRPLGSVSERSSCEGGSDGRFVAEKTESPVLAAVLGETARLVQVRAEHTIRIGIERVEGPAAFSKWDRCAWGATCYDMTGGRYACQFGDAVDCSAPKMMLYR
jgi:hypothetical protein